jgi:ribonuclease HI
MAAHPFYIYTDASFSKIKLLAVSGFLIFRNSEDHEAGVTSLSSIRTHTFPEKTNIRAELRGVLWALEATPPEITPLHERKSPEKIEIFLYTDCQAVLQLLARREKLEASGFRSRRKNKILPNADLYQAFFAHYDQWAPKIIWVKGHSPRRGQDLIQKNFSRIDQVVRKELKAKVRG